MRLFALVLMVFATSAFADGWRVETVDRGAKEGSSIAASMYDLNHKDREGALTIVKNGDGSYAVTVDSGATPIFCDPEVCKLVAKFGNGKYAEYLAYLARDGKAIVHYAAKRFARAVSKVDESKVDLHFHVLSARQLIFQVKGMPFAVEPDPKLSFLKYPLGEHRDNIAGLPAKGDKTADIRECFKDLSSEIFVNIPIKAEAMACFVNGEMETLLLNLSRARKSDLAALDRGLNALYGKPQVIGKHKTWPSLVFKDRPHRWHTYAFVADSGDEVSYFLMDQSLSDLVPTAR